MATSTSLPGPHVDLVPVMARWWERWLRGEHNGVDQEPALTWFAQHSTRPGADRAVVEGEWRSAHAWPLPGASTDVRPLGEDVVTYDVLADVGTAAWNSCAGSLPWGQPTDQRFDDAASLTWSWPADTLSLLGHPRLRLRVASSAPVAFVSAKLCDVFPDGTSSLLSRGLLNLTHRSSSSSPEPLPVDKLVDVEVELEAMSWVAAPGHSLRLSVAGTDWPNTLAPPAPVRLTIDCAASSLELPFAGDSSPTTDPLIVWTPTHHSDGAPGAGESKGSWGDRGNGGVTWRVERDVLGRMTACVVDHGSEYDVDGGSAIERYTGRTTVDTQSFEQRAEASADFTLRWPEATVRARAELSWQAGPTSYDIALSAETWQHGEPTASRQWQRTIERDLT
jgi:hypothetical protein